MSEELENLMQDFCYVEGCQALYKKENYIEYCRKCEYNCPQFQVVEQFVSYGTKIENQVKQLQQRIDKAIEKLSFIDKALEEDILNIPLCIVKINNSINIFKGDSNV